MQIDLPTVVLGAGTIAVAHSKDEQIDMQDIARTAELLVKFLLDYCGTDE